MKTNRKLASVFAGACAIALAGSSLVACTPSENKNAEPENTNAIENVVIETQYGRITQIDPDYNVKVELGTVNFDKHSAIAEAVAEMGEKVADIATNAANTIKEDKGETASVVKRAAGAVAQTAGEMARTFEDVGNDNAKAADGEPVAISETEGEAIEEAAAPTFEGNGEDFIFSLEGVEIVDEDGNKIAKEDLLTGMVIQIQMDAAGNVETIIVLSGVEITGGIVSGSVTEVSGTMDGEEIETEDVVETAEK